MRNLIVTSLAAVLIAAAGFTPQVDAGPATAPNLLVNPGFENPYSKQCCHTESWAPPTLPIDEVQVANGWRGWWLEPGDAEHPTNCAGCTSWHRPEWREAAPFANRIHSGGNAQKYFTFFSTHEAGMYQQVSGVTPGQPYRFTVYMHAWSTTGSSLTSTVVDNDLDMRVGIDPAGGANPFSANIVWSSPFNAYDTWTLFTVEAVAQNSTLTVYTHTKPRWGMEHNDVYVDDASLTAVDGSAVVAPTATSAPTSVPTAAPTSAPAASATVGSASAASPTTVPTTIPATAAPAVPTATQAQLANYTLQRGDSLYSVALRFGTSVSAIMAVNSIADARRVFAGQVIRLPLGVNSSPTTAPASSAPTAAPTAAQVAASAPAGLSTYTVQRGDTLFSIGRKYNVTTAAIIAVNPTINPNRIFAGQVINLPVTNTGASKTYVVQRGDTLRNIASRFGTTTAILQSFNGLTDPNRIFVGQTLVVP